MPVATFGKLTKKMFDIIDSTDNTVNVLNIFERLALDAIGIAGFGKSIMTSICILNPS
jgi:hypothetical protein